MNKRAFTLIELLIVIAIIAILALIAIPNFLEAQTRGKVSRVYADMRTVAVAIHAYTVDYNRAPVGINEGWSPKVKMWPDQETGGISWQKQITTPVAYLTSVPRDPFVATDMPGIRKEWKTFSYQYQDDPSAPSYQVDYKWWLQSGGPSGKLESPWFYEMINQGHSNGIYDPTNGTMSKGNIWWTNKGLFTKP